jgi:hypothetical protein
MKKKAEAFVKVPIWWAVEATKATKTPKALVWIRLLHAAWKTKNSSFPLPNGLLAKDGVTRFAKYRALRELEAAGLITVERRPRKTPLVTLTVL